MGGKPAARLGDNHICPLPNPHVGGPILPPCCPNVLIGNQPAARVDDKALCNGPVDTIATGSATVLIGGKKAARIGDTTKHGGVIVQGEPTVLIGDTSFSGTASSEPKQAPRLQQAAKDGKPFCEKCPMEDKAETPES